MGTVVDAIAIDITSVTGAVLNRSRVAESQAVQRSEASCGRATCISLFAVVLHRASRGDERQGSGGGGGGLERN